MDIHSREFTIFLGALLCIFIYVNFIRKSLHLDLVKSTVNNQEYYVRKLPDKQEAADRLAHLKIERELNNFRIILIPILLPKIYPDLCMWHTR